MGWLFVVIPMVVLIVAGTILAIVLGLGKLTEPIDATNDYLSALQDGRYEDAYALLCDERRDTQTEEEFVRAVENEADEQGRVTGFDFKSSEITNGRATTEGTLEIDGVEYDARARLHDEDGDWRVCSVTFDG